MLGGPTQRKDYAETSCEETLGRGKCRTRLRKRRRRGLENNVAEGTVPFLCEDGESKSPWTGSFKHEEVDDVQRLGGSYVLYLWKIPTLAKNRAHADSMRSHCRASFQVVHFGSVGSVAEVKEPIEWGRLHVGAERGVNYDPVQAVLTKILWRHREWQEDRRTDLERLGVRVLQVRQKMEDNGMGYLRWRRSRYKSTSIYSD